MNYLHNIVTVRFIPLLFIASLFAPTAYASTFTFSPSSVDLCAGLPSTSILTPTSTETPMNRTRPEPALGGSYTSNLGAKVIRITDVEGTTGKVGVNAPMYSTIPAWNADESYLILYQTHGYYSGSDLSSGWMLYNGKTYQFIRELPIAAADVEDVYWSSTDPDIFYYITDYGYPASNYGPVLVKFSVSANSGMVIHNFSANLPSSPNAKVDFGHILYMNWNNTLVGIRQIINGSTQAINSQSYNIATGVENGWHAYSGGQPYQGLQIAPTGNVAIIGSKVVDPVSQAVLRTMTTDTEEHGSFGILANGHDAWVSSQFDGDNNSVGNVVVEDLENGVVTPIIGMGNGWPYPPVTTHISTTAFQNQGWVGVSIVGNPKGQGLLDSTLVLANINTGKVCAVAHMHSNGSGEGSGTQGYWAEPHVVISPTGTRLLFGSDWGSGYAPSSSSDSVDSFVVELPSYNSTTVSSPVNGSCSATHYSCTAGSSTDGVNGSSSYTWTCAGTNGGSSASCSETKTVPAPTPTSGSSSGGSGSSGSSSSGSSSSGSSSRGSSSRGSSSGGGQVVQRIKTATVNTTAVTLRNGQVVYIDTQGNLTDSDGNPISIAEIISRQKVAQNAQASNVQNFVSSQSQGSVGADVLRLQQFLNNHGFTVAVSGPGSKGHETNYFGPLTKSAVKAFQQAHAQAILAPLGLTRGTGFFGSSTIAFINANW